VRALLSTPLAEAWSIEHVATHCDGSVFSRLVAFAWGVVRYLRALGRRPTVVHLHTASYGSFARKALLTWIAMAARVPVVLHVHGGEFHIFYDRLPRTLRFLVRVTLTRAAAVIALGEVWASRLASIAPRARITVLSNGVRAMSPVAQPGPAGLVHVVFLGDVTDAKGVFTLLDAWAKMHGGGDCARARLTLAGAGETERARRRVEELEIGRTVTVLGWVEPDEVPALLRTAQVLALPSRAEGQPMVVLEAMANGLCVVASDVGGIPDLLDGPCGLLVPPDDMHRLADALLQATTDHEARIELGAAAFAKVQREHDIDVIWRRIDELYRSVMR
jgi:glycosyltransferase involved in cell wall biosynthesis